MAHCGDSLNNYSEFRTLTEKLLRTFKLACHWPPAESVQAESVQPTVLFRVSVFRVLLCVHKMSPQWRPSSCNSLVMQLQRLHRARQAGQLALCATACMPWQPSGYEFMCSIVRKHTDINNDQRHGTHTHKHTHKHTCTERQAERERELRHKK